MNTVSQFINCDLLNKFKWFIVIITYDYFIATKIDLSEEKDPYKDYQFTKKFAKEVGVLAIPPSAFYSQQHKSLGENYARFCFIKVSNNKHEAVYIYIW